MPSNFRSKIHSGPVKRSCVSVAAMGTTHSGNPAATLVSYHDASSGRPPSAFGSNVGPGLHSSHRGGPCLSRRRAVVLGGALAVLCATCQKDNPRYWIDEGTPDGSAVDGATDQPTDVGSCAPSKCSPYLCAGAVCATSCGGPTDCAPGFACSGGQCNSLGVGLLGHWKLDEGQGTTTRDDSGNGHDGVLENGAAWEAGAFPGARLMDPFAMRFDGVDDQVTVPRSTGLEPPTVTVTAWINADSAQKSCGNIARKAYSFY